MVVMDLGGGGAEPVSVAEAKIWARIDRGDEDALIGALINAAREMVERETALVLVRRNFRLVVETVPADRRVALPRRPLGAVTAVTAIGSNGTPKSFPASAAVADRSRGMEALRVSAEVAGAAVEGVEIELSAGYEAAAVPEALKLAVKRIVAASYEMRGVVAVDGQPAVVPKAAHDLIAPFRRRSL